LELFDRLGQCRIFFQKSAASHSDVLLESGNCGGVKLRGQLA
jgi:hypothetical protein